MLNFMNFNSLSQIDFFLQFYTKIPLLFCEYIGLSKQKSIVPACVYWDNKVYGM